MKKFKSFRSEITEAKINPSDYTATSEKSKFGGHRAKVVHKTKGTLMYLGSDGFKTPKAAVAAADAYLTGYAISGDNGAQRMMQAHIKNNKKNLVDPSVLDTKESVDEAGPTYIDGVKYQKEKKKKGFNKDDWEWNSSKQLYKKVDEAVALDEAFLRLPGEMINGELPMAIRDLESILRGLKAGNDFDAKGFNKQIARLNTIKKEAKKFNSEDEVPTRYQYRADPRYKNK